MTNITTLYGRSERLLLTPEMCFVAPRLCLGVAGEIYVRGRSCHLTEWTTCDGLARESVSRVFDGS